MGSLKKYFGESIDHPLLGTPIAFQIYPLILILRLKASFHTDNFKSRTRLRKQQNYSEAMHKFC